MLHNRVIPCTKHIIPRRHIGQKDVVSASCSRDRSKKRSIFSGTPPSRLAKSLQFAAVRRAGAVFLSLSDQIIDRENPDSNVLIIAVGAKKQGRYDARGAGADSTFGSVVKKYRQDVIERALASSSVGGIDVELDSADQIKI